MNTIRPINYDNFVRSIKIQKKSSKNEKIIEYHTFLNDFVIILRFCLKCKQIFESHWKRKCPICKSKLIKLKPGDRLDLKNSDFKELTQITSFKEINGFLDKKFNVLNTIDYRKLGFNICFKCRFFNETKYIYCVKCCNNLKFQNFEDTNIVREFFNFLLKETQISYSLKIAPLPIIIRIIILRLRK